MNISYNEIFTPYNFGPINFVLKSIEYFSLREFFIIAIQLLLFLKKEKHSKIPISDFAEKNDCQERCHREQDRGSITQCRILFQADRANRGNGEIRDIDYEVPEQHGGQQPIRIREQNGSGLFTRASISHVSSIPRLKIEQCRFTGREKTGAGHQDCHGA